MLDRFKTLAESSWSGMRIRDLNCEGDLGEEELTLLIQDSDFVAEIGWMGHGLQMWLQTMWFLARSASSQTVILDEPDVYMHADLQRKLINLVRRRFTQTVVATHSVEIMSEVGPDQVLVIDRHRPKSTFTTSLPAVQRVIDNIGGVHNLQLARFWTARKCLFLEGKDMAFLKVIYNTLYPNSEISLDSLPRVSIGGWSGWPYAIGSTMLLRNASGEDITPFCILDSDYHTPPEIAARLQEARDRHVQLHIWSKKEIENYLIVPTAIGRIIASEIGPPNSGTWEDQLWIAIDQICDALRDEVFDTYANEFHNQDRRSGLASANKMARDLVDPLWKTREGRLSRVSGKQLLASLSEWSKKTLNVSFGVAAIARELTVGEIDQEMKDVLKRIETRQPFNVTPPVTKPTSGRR